MHSCNESCTPVKVTFNLTAVLQFERRKELVVRAASDCKCQKHIVLLHAHPMAFDASRHALGAAMRRVYILRLLCVDSCYHTEHRQQGHNLFHCYLHFALFLETVKKGCFLFFRVFSLALLIPYIIQTIENRKPTTFLPSDDRRFEYGITIVLLVAQLLEIDKCERAILR